MRAWSVAAENKLRALYATTPLPRLAFLLKRTEKAVRSRAKILGLRRSNRKPWTRKEDQLLRRRYPNEPTETIARALGRNVAAVSSRALIHLKLRKSAAHMARDRARQAIVARANPRMVANQFKPGLVPANKGQRRPGWYVGRMRETQFKKGRLAHEARNYVPIGTEKIDPKRKVLMRKVTDDPRLFPVNRWRPVHVIVWEAANGAVPPGHIVIFRAGLKTFDSKLITADRLELVTLAENLRRNSIHNRYPADVKQVIQLRGALNRKINNRLRGRARHEEQDGGRSQPPGRDDGRAGRQGMQARGSGARQGDVAGSRAVHRRGES